MRDSHTITGRKVLSKQSLAYNYKLSEESISIDLSLTDTTAGKWELQDSDDVLKYSVLTNEEIRQQRYRFREISSKDDNEVRKLTEEIIDYECKRFPELFQSEITKYIKRIIDNLKIDTLNNARLNTLEACKEIKDKISKLETAYCIKQFWEKCAASDISCDVTEPNGFYQFPDKIDTGDKEKLSISYNKSLYERCNGVSGFEAEILKEIDGSENVLWWHRIIAGGSDEFSLNGPINHYPDFVARTKTGVTVLIEAKGPQLKNEDSELKIKMGAQWEKCAGSAFKYYMVFESNPMDGAITSNKLRNYLDNLKP